MAFVRMTKKPAASDVFVFRPRRGWQPGPLAGFRLTLGFTVFAISLAVLLPLILQSFTLFNHMTVAENIACVHVELREWFRPWHEAIEGRIQQVGSPEDVYENPITPFVASFSGVANVLYGQVKAGDASIGSLSLQASAHIPDGASVRPIVRPHDIRKVLLDLNQARFFEEDYVI